MKHREEITRSRFLPRSGRHWFASAGSLSDSADKGKRRTLIVDDDANSTHLVKILLERSGPYLVLEENDAANADQTARNLKPDMILLDIVMPKIDGGELPTQIEADRELHDTPIMFVTALVTHGLAKSGLHIQGHPLLAKPDQHSRVNRSD